MESNGRNILRVYLVKKIDIDNPEWAEKVACIANLFARAYSKGNKYQTCINL